MKIILKWVFPFAHSVISHFLSKKSARLILMVPWPEGLVPCNYQQEVILVAEWTERRTETECMNMMTCNYAPSTNFVLMPFTRWKPRKHNKLCDDDSHDKVLCAETRLTKPMSEDSIFTRCHSVDWNVAGGRRRIINKRVMMLPVCATQCRSDKNP